MEKLLIIDSCMREESRTKVILNDAWNLDYMPAETVAEKVRETDVLARKIA